MAARLIKKAVPGKILHDIKAHIRKASKDGEAGFRSAPRSEDTLTGDWCRAVKVGWSELVNDGVYFWRWRIDYRKFSGGNQRSSEEQPTGSDGILQVEVETFRVAVTENSPSTVRLENVELERAFRKGILFQAKRYDSTERERLVGQLNMMEKITPGEALYVEFGPKAYRAALAKDMVRVDGFADRLTDSEIMGLGELCNRQVPGVRKWLEGMYVDFDTEPQELHFPRMSERILEVQRELLRGQGLRIKITAFKMVEFVED